MRCLVEEENQYCTSQNVTSRYDAAQRVVVLTSLHEFCSSFV